VDFDEWKLAMEINVYGVLLFCRELIPHFKANGRGKIINLSGGGATARCLHQRLRDVQGRGRAPHRTLAEELRAARIDVNAVAPGALNTRLLDEVLSAGPPRWARRSIKRRSNRRRPAELRSHSARASASGSPARSDGITGKLLSAQWDPWKDLAAKRDALAKVRHLHPPPHCARGSRAEVELSHHA